MRDEQTAHGVSAPNSPPTGFAQPSAEQLLEGVLTLGREVHLEMDEKSLVDLFLRTLGGLFPNRLFSVRTFDPRSNEAARIHSSRELHPGVEVERIVLKPSSLEKTRLKSALAASARIRVSTRWESPFPGVSFGFTTPLVASGELYGVLDVGYPAIGDVCDTDESLVLPIANHLSVALRNERMHREMILLRDYQAKLIEHANALILGVDRDWRVTVCNQALSRLTGFSHDELLGMDVRKWLPDSELRRLSKLFLQALAGRRTDTVDVSLVTRTGELVRTVWSIATIDSHGRVQTVVAIGQDQTKLRELQQQVIHAEKLATLGQLSAGVVHELNNPLTSITVYAEYLLKKAEAATQSDAGGTVFDTRDVEKLRRIGVGAQRILSLSRDLVQYAKPHGDDYSVVDLNQVTRQSLSFCEHLFDRFGVALVEDFGDGLPGILVVPGQVEQIVINLVTNAVQALIEGGEVRVRTYEYGPSQIALCIQDNGPGIADEQKSSIFDPFYTTKTDGKGTGLGLSIVRNLVEQQSATIEVSDAPDGGACFTVVFSVEI